MNLRRAIQVLFFVLLIKPFLTLFIGLRVFGRERLPAHDPFVLIANHSSHLDAICLLALFPISRLHRIRPVAAADYFERNRAVSLLSRTLFHILPIARSKITAANHPVQAMLGAIRRGESLILFPEGTRGASETAAFRPGVAHLIEEAPGIPVTPVWLVNMGRSLPKGEWIPLPFFCEVRIGPPITPRGARSEILAALEAAVSELKPA